MLSVAWLACVAARCGLALSLIRSRLFCRMLTGLSRSPSQLLSPSAALVLSLSLVSHFLQRELPVKLLDDYLYSKKSNNQTCFCSSLSLHLIPALFPDS